MGTDGSVPQHRGTSKIKKLLRFSNDQMVGLISHAERTGNSMLPDLMAAHLKTNQFFQDLEAESLLREALIERRSAAKVRFSRLAQFSDERFDEPLLAASAEVERLDRMISALS